MPGVAFTTVAMLKYFEGEACTCTHPQGSAVQQVALVVIAMNAWNWQAKTAEVWLWLRAQWRVSSLTARPGTLQLLASAIDTK